MDAIEEFNQKIRIIYQQLNKFENIRFQLSKQEKEQLATVNTKLQRISDKISEIADDVDELQNQLDNGIPEEERTLEVQKRIEEYEELENLYHIFAPMITMYLLYRR